ncbi:MAG TPA: DoxX family protein [Candidatus Paceibacterota bacterium]|nr:DoxX family protein [Candidatus Paceibacterota bacterium]
MNNLWDSWAPMVARVLLAIQFCIAAFFKITGFSGEAAMTAAVGVPFSTVAVALALVLEVIGIVSLLTGYRLRLIGALLAGYVLLLAALFYHNWTDQMSFGLFVSHLGLAAALMLASVYSAPRVTPKLSVM